MGNTGGPFHQTSSQIFNMIYIFTNIETMDTIKYIYITGKNIES